VKAAELVDVMTELRIAAQRCAKAMEDFTLAYYKVNEYGQDRKAWDEAEELYRDLKARMRGFNV